MAGTLFFGGGVTTRDTPAGELLRWENKSGHYFWGGVKPNDGAVLRGPALIKHVDYQTQLLKCQDGTRLLPMDKFEEWSGEI